MVGEEGHQILVNREMIQRGRLGIGKDCSLILLGSVPDKNKLLQWNETIEKEGTVTDIINRKYFYSVYFRDPGQIIYELATTGPGFDCGLNVC